MREIKFRAWDECRKRYFTRPKWVEFKVDAQGVLSCSNYAYSGNIQELIVEQHTGLKDCNGVEIYEGDVVKVSYGKDRPFIDAVKYDCEIGFTPLQVPCDYDEIYLSMQDVEVIGNIHENPGLLEDKQ